MLRALRLPGEIELAIERLILITHGGLAVNLRQPRANDGVKRLRDNLMLRQKRFHRVALLRCDINQKKVRAFRRQLLLPAVEQIAS